MVRFATVRDAEQLEILNAEFNGDGETCLEAVKESLLHNRQEIVIVDEEAEILAGFLCVQLKKSFCYEEYMPEITELYVKPGFRRRGIAKEMLLFAENYCVKNFSFHEIILLTGDDNDIAQALYRKLGYRDEGEIHLAKPFPAPVEDFAPDICKIGG
ncbi:MAG TPA: GNAT family N-acetyltransferase [Candidatus Merdivicinus intestinavium]|nr:GNAT family N-acetyltransferase [Candidatus Merdivicinus intestinavium]